MASLYTRRNLFFGRKNKLARVPINRNSTPVISCAFTSALSLALTSSPGLSERYTDENLQKTTKMAPELFVKGQKYCQLQANFALRKQPLKT